MQEDSERRLKELNERKGFNYHQPYYGPIETEEISQLLRDKKITDQYQMRTLLIEQMKEKTKQQELEKQREKELDKVFSTNLSLAVQTLQKGVL
jgi:hypothetical protein